MPQLDDLYKEVILDHYRRPRRRGTIDVPPATHARGYNPLCGDEIDMYVSVGASGEIEAIAFEGKGCAISQASASMLTERVQGGTVADFGDAFDRFKAMLGLGDDDGPAFSTDEELGRQLGDAEALQAVREFPSRIKCATLAWNTLDQALAGRESFEET